MKNIIDDKIKNYSYSEKRSFKDICSEDSKPMNITTMEIILYPFGTGIGMVKHTQIMGLMIISDLV